MVKALVYGTLKRGYGNSRLLEGATYLGDYLVPGYKLFDSGFPVACKSEGSSVLGELYKIPEGREEEYFRNLDRLESNGRMYIREVVTCIDGDTGDKEEAWMYVGHPRFWDFENMRECPEDNLIYIWSR